MKNELEFNNSTCNLDFDHINEYAKKFRLSVERDAFFEGVRLDFQVASNRYFECLSELDKRRTNSIIVVENNEIKRLDKRKRQFARG